LRTKLTNVKHILGPNLLTRDMFENCVCNFDELEDYGDNA